MRTCLPLEKTGHAHRLQACLQVAGIIKHVCYSAKLQQQNTYHPGLMAEIQLLTQAVTGLTEWRCTVSLFLNQKRVKDV